MTHSRAPGAHGSAAIRHSAGLPRATWFMKLMENNNHADADA
jgi:hypothetical protein